MPLRLMVSTVTTMAETTTGEVTEITQETPLILIVVAMAITVMYFVIAMMILYKETSAMLIGVGILITTTLLTTVIMPIIFQGGTLVTFILTRITSVEKGTF